MTMNTTCLEETRTVDKDKMVQDSSLICDKDNMNMNDPKKLRCHRGVDGEVEDNIKEEGEERLDLFEHFARERLMEKKIREQAYREYVTKQPLRPEVVNSTPKEAKNPEHHDASTSTDNNCLFQDPDVATTMSDVVGLNSLLSYKTGNVRTMKIKWEDAMKLRNPLLNITPRGDGSKEKEKTNPNRIDGGIKATNETPDAPKQVISDTPEVHNAKDVKPIPEVDHETDLSKNNLRQPYDDLETELNKFSSKAYHGLRFCSHDHPKKSRHPKTQIPEVPGQLDESSNSPNVKPLQQKSKSHRHHLPPPIPLFPPRELDGSTFSVRSKVPVDFDAETYRIAFPQENLSDCEEVLRPLEVDDTPDIMKTKKALHFWTENISILYNLNKDFDGTVEENMIARFDQVHKSKTEVNFHDTGMKYASRCFSSTSLASSTSSSSSCASRKSESKNYKVCQKCKKLIKPHDPVFEMEAQNGSGYNSWHEKCMVCTKCHNGLGANPRDHFFIDGKIYCKDDYVSMINSLESIVCFGCGEIILDSSYTSASGSSWHAKCFNCSSCLSPIKDGEYVANEGSIFCVRCYEKESLRFCASCNGKVRAGETYIQSGNYYWHYNDPCLHCGTCDQSLVGHSLFFRKTKELYCNRYCAIRGPI